ncbi:MAG: cupredoxin domain-containing protein [Chloroflexi bacterium]|nr:cupredoxin domain-containing protein [Chloroflexota bacterium]
MPKKITAVLIVSGVVILIALIGCSGTMGMGGMGMMGKMMGNGMMGMHNAAPNVNVTPVPATQAIDREIKLIARNSKFEPTRIDVKKNETIRFVIVNEDAFAHNFVSQDGGIAYTLLPANATQSVVWVASERGTFTAWCTLHAGMQIQINVE